jgi:hypothetical protein
MVYTEIVFIVAIGFSNCSGGDKFGKIRNCPRAVTGL